MSDLDAQERCAIGIDCPPGNPRPGALFPSVLRGSSLRVADFQKPQKLLGAWTWYLKENPQKEAIFLTKRSLFDKRLAKLVETKKARGVLLTPDVTALRLVR
jgi:hypothetical protein